MEIENLITQTESNIWQAIDDYAEYTTQREILDDISEDFVTTLARDSVRAKQELRNLFSKSTAWDPELDAIVINGTHTHNPDYALVGKLARKMLSPLLDTNMPYHEIASIAYYFACPADPGWQKTGLETIEKYAPGAYVPGKKLSRVFRSICKLLNIYDDSAGSDFQKWYAMFADELSGKQIDFKLYLSINPAHFLTMSNPKLDTRGETLVSCHSLNSTEHPYNVGCTGYARDPYSFIVFTVADAEEPQTFNNRKTTRQMFAYQPGNGLLFQSRLYNTHGGTRGAQEESKLYRDLVQREISALEDVPNLWKTWAASEDDIVTGHGFGGYKDWAYGEFDAKVSIRNDHADDYKPLTIGAHGLCIRCGETIDSGLYCDYCDTLAYCDCCQEWTHTSNVVYEYDGDYPCECSVCDDCLDKHYTWCRSCGRYIDNNYIVTIDGRDMCVECKDELCGPCGCCGTVHLLNKLTPRHECPRVLVCADCSENAEREEPA